MRGEDARGGGMSGAWGMYRVRERGAMGDVQGEGARGAGGRGDDRGAGGCDIS